MPSGILSAMPRRCLALIAALAVLCAAFVSIGTASAKKKPPKKPKFQVSALPIDVSKDPWAWVPITDWPAHSYPPIHVFGHTYIDGKTEAALTIMMLKIGTPVIASYSGVVTRIQQQPETCDTEVYIDLPSGSTLHGSYDHITPSVAVGQKVTAGQVIGSVPAWQCNQPFGGMELMVIESSSSEARARCPLSIVAPPQKAPIAGQVRGVMMKWNAYVGDFTSSAGSPAYSADDLARGICQTTYAPAN